MLKRKAVEQIARTARRTKNLEFETPKHEVKNSQKGHLQHNQRVGNDCHEDQMHATALNHDVKDKAKDDYDPLFNATYTQDPQLPGLKGQTDLIKARLEKRNRTDASAFDDETGPPDKRQALNAITKKQSNKRVPNIIFLLRQSKLRGQ